jgi:hypothetical protein
MSTSRLPSFDRFRPSARRLVVRVLAAVVGLVLLAVVYGLARLIDLLLR